MATNWTYQSAAGSFLMNQGSGAGTVACTPIPLVGDLMILSWTGRRATTAFTSCVPSDNGSSGATNTGINPWKSAVTFQTSSLATAQMWWKVAQAADNNAGAGITVTCTPAGGSGTISAQSICSDDFRLDKGLLVVGIDIAGALAFTTAATTKSWNPGSGSTYAAFTDALAYTSRLGYSSGGGQTGTNTFTGTSAAQTLASAVSGGFIVTAWAGVNQDSATAGSNTWENTWTNSAAGVVMGANFIYRGGGGFFEFFPG